MRRGQGHVGRQRRDWAAGGAWIKIGAMVAASPMVEMDYYVMGLQALVAARDVSRAKEKEEWPCRLAMGLVDEYACTVRLVVEKPSAAGNELVESRLQVVAARLEAGIAKRVAMARRARVKREWQGWREWQG